MCSKKKRINDYWNIKLFLENLSDPWDRVHTICFFFPPGEEKKSQSNHNANRLRKTTSHHVDFPTCGKSPTTSWLQGVSPSARLLPLRLSRGTGESPSLRCSQGMGHPLHPAMLVSAFLRRIAGSFLPASLRELADK